MGGGSAPKAQAAPPPPPPSRWWYDKNGDAQEYKPISSAIPTGRYISPNAAAESNPKVYIYDNMGNSVKQIFKEDADAGNYDTKAYNLGSKSVPYKYWYDQYGIQQVYAPTSTQMGAGYYDSPTKAPNSPNFQPAVSLDEVKANLNTGATTSSSTDLEAAKVKAQKRKQTTQTRSLTMLGDTSSEDNKNLTGE